MIVSSLKNAFWRCGVVICCVVLCALGGCAAKPQSTANAMAAPGGNVNYNAPLNKPAGMTQTAQVVAGVLPLGVVPYDNQTLPLPSPDGRLIATQTGAPPTWETTLAEPGASVPYATRIEVYQLDLREGIQPQDRLQPLRIATLAEPVLLGQSCDAEGFLVESPREDGSRWIGKASWSSGEINWLINDNAVNAFASLGPAGRLAWSRRAIDGERFELVIRNAAGGSEWVIGSAAEDYLMPSWSGRGDGLFLFNLRGDTLDLCYAMATSDAAVRQSIQRLNLASEAADVYTAYQCIAGQAGAIDGSLPTRDQLVFFHPALRRVALWRPLAAPDKQRTQLNAGSVAALVDQEHFAFVSTSKNLIRQNLRNPNERIDLVAGTQVPRQTTSTTWPYLLLSPDEGRIGVMAMRLLPMEESLFTRRQAAR